MYTDVINSMNGARTIKEHITKLQAILDSIPVDPQLASYLHTAITSLMRDQFNAAKSSQASQKVRLSQATTTEHRQLYSYCQHHATTGTPQWTVAASRAGWTPPAKP